MDKELKENLELIILRTQEKNNRYERLLEYLKSLDLYIFEPDYDWEENIIDNYYPFDMATEIDEWLKNDAIEEGYYDVVYYENNN